MFESNAIDHVFWNALAIEVQKDERIDHAIPAPGLVPDALDLVEELAVMAPEFRSRFELLLGQSMFD